MKINRYTYCDNEGAVLDDFSANIQIYKDGKLVDKKIFNINSPVYETTTSVSNGVSNDVVDPNTFFSNGLNYLKNII
jgi:hypothetical protein